MINRMTAILMAGMAVSSCEGNILHKNPPDDSKIAYSKAVTYAPATGVSEDEAHDLATETLTSMSFDDVADASMCTVDCEGHDAGFQWAKENGYTDASSCSGNSQSFIEGCEAYGAAFERQVQEQLEGETDAS